MLRKGWSRNKLVMRGRRRRRKKEGGRSRVRNE
jgi:hypothetical protein